MKKTSIIGMMLLTSSLSLMASVKPQLQEIITFNFQEDRRAIINKQKERHSTVKAGIQTNFDGFKGRIDIASRVVTAISSALYDAIPKQLNNGKDLFKDNKFQERLIRMQAYFKDWSSELAEIKSSIESDIGDAERFCSFEKVKEHFSSLEQVIELDTIYSELATEFKASIKGLDYLRDEINKIEASIEKDMQLLSILINENSNV